MFIFYNWWIHYYHKTYPLHLHVFEHLGALCIMGRNKIPQLSWYDIPKVTRQDKTRQDKTRQDKTRQDKTRQDKTRQDKTRQDKTRQDKTRQDKTRQGKARQGKARQGKARQDKTRQDKTRQDNASIIELQRKKKNTGAIRIILSVTANWCIC